MHFAANMKSNQRTESMNRVLKMRINNIHRTDICKIFDVLNEIVEHKGVATSYALERLSVSLNKIF